MKKILSVLLVLVLLVSFTVGCGKKAPDLRGDRKDVRYDTPLVVGYDPFSAKFSTFYMQTSYDMDVVEMTQAPLLTTDRTGAIVFNAIQGETRSYNGTEYTYYGIADVSQSYDKEKDISTYRATLRDDLVFSDGTPMTADDIIFNYYVYLDPSYVGFATLSSYDIIGLNEYRTQATAEEYEKYSAIAKAIDEAGRDHTWTSADSWTKEQQDLYWEKYDAAWKVSVGMLVEAIVSTYGTAYASMFGYEYSDLIADEKLQVVFAMALWGFADFDDDGNLVTAVNGLSFTLEGDDFPTVDTFYQECFDAYEGDGAAYWETEASSEGIEYFGKTAIETFVAAANKLDNPDNAGVPNISGIKKIDKYTVELTLKGFAAPAIYSLLGIQISPMHYYGDPEQYDYENNKFGFPRGDLSLIKRHQSEPMGAGPYKFIKYENKVVYFEANEHYFKGEPYITNVQFKEVIKAEMAAGIQSGTIDMGELSGSRKNFDEVKSYNSNGELSGDVIETRTNDFLGYGYIGMNADTVNVNGQAASDASKNLRRALATLISVYRDTAVNSYYGDVAVLINYPISNTSWAAPQPTDDGYQIAFSTDVNGNPIYTSGMSPDERYAAALQASVEFLQAAGYTFTNGKVTGVPSGNRGSNGGSYTEFEVIIPGDGVGEHPSFSIVTNVAAALETIGITLTINDPADSNVLWNALNAGKQDLWCAAWGATIDPDMVQVYHSDNVTGAGGTDSNHYHIASEELDKLMTDARKSDDQDYRKLLYKDALDVIIDWAVEVPIYQRQDCTIFSVKRINIETVTPDSTTFYRWILEIENFELNN